MQMTAFRFRSRPWEAAEEDPPPLPEPNLFGGERLMNSVTDQPGHRPDTPYQPLWYPLSFFPSTPSPPVCAPSDKKFVSKAWGGLEAQQLLLPRLAWELKGKKKKILSGSLVISVRRGDRSRTRPPVAIHLICIISTAETPAVPFDWHLRWTFVLHLLLYLEDLKAEQRERNGDGCLHKLFKLERHKANKAPPPEWPLATAMLATVAFSRG